ncbi:MAG: hypothetical protein Kow0065_07260 [Methylomicrobium sp.]
MISLLLMLLTSSAVGAAQKGERPSNDAVVSPIDHQDNSIESLKRLQSGVRSVLNDALAELKKRVESGPPFLLSERRARIEQLEKLLLDPDAEAADQFRRIVDAYRIELDYAKTVDAYRGILKHAADERLVDFLSIGRLALYYQTPDGRESGLWRADRREWQSLSGEDNEAVAQALRIARKLEPPQLMRLPLPGPLSR